MYIRVFSIAPTPPSLCFTPLMPCHQDAIQHCHFRLHPLHHLGSLLPHLFVSALPLSHPCQGRFLDEELHVSSRHPVHVAMHCIPAKRPTLTSVALSPILLVISSISTTCMWGGGKL
ncbi:unnamed protein product [Closterium sp. Yama58-4]|nr:unnamed protein product [Closterium sp. Yama58-4]